jgi:hypothetical protein
MSWPRLSFYDPRSEAIEPSERAGTRTVLIWRRAAHFKVRMPTTAERTPSHVMLRRRRLSLHDTNSMQCNFSSNTTMQLFLKYVPIPQLT